MPGSTAVVGSNAARAAPSVASRASCFSRSRAHLSSSFSAFRASLSRSLASSCSLASRASSSSTTPYFLALAPLGVRLGLVSPRDSRALRLLCLLYSRLPSLLGNPLGDSLIVDLLLCRALAGCLH